jgi:secreted trypsin-like serine protease
MMPARLLGLVFVLVSVACSAPPRDASQTRVIGGREAGPHPFMAGLMDEGGSQAYCGGSFIAPDVVLTAAHCVQGAPARMRVSAGLHDNSAHGRVNTISVAAVRIHPDYGPDQAMQNDLALLFLAPYDPRVLPGPVAPIALNADPDLPRADGGLATVIGWGNTSSYGDVFADGLHEAEVPIIPRAQCASAYPGITGKQICAGDFARGGVDSCQGDSGGPLVAGGVLVGVVSFGEGCAQAKQPGVYTRVAAFKGWIEAEVRRFRAAQPADTGDIALAHCYAKLNSVASPSEGRNELRLVTSYVAAGPFAAAGAAPAASARMSPCAFDRNGERWSVSLGAGKPSLVVKRGAQLVAAPAATQLKADLFCGPSAGGGALNLLYDSTGAQSQLRFDGETLELGGELSGDTAGASVERVCTVRDFSLRILRRGDALIAEVTSPALGGARRYELKDAPDAGKRLALSFAPASARSGTVPGRMSGCLAAS